MELRFPVVEGYAFALRKNLIKCDVASMEELVVEPHREPTATFLTATVGYKEGHAASGSLVLPLIEQDRHTYYEQNHIETIKFNLARIAYAGAGLGRVVYLRACRVSNLNVQKST